MNNCELCSFKNPKGVVSAVIISRGRLLLLETKNMVLGFILPTIIFTILDNNANGYIL